MNQNSISYQINYLLSSKYVNSIIYWSNLSEFLTESTLKKKNESKFNYFIEINDLLWSKYVNSIIY